MPRECLNRANGFRVCKCIWGLAGSLVLLVSAVTSDWHEKRGLWDDATISEITQEEYNQTARIDSSRALEAERVFSAVAAIMAISSFCICLLVLFCWPSSKNVYSKLSPGQLLNPGSLLLAVLVPTGVFFLLGWSIFTWHHWARIQQDMSKLGFSYWLGASAWVTLLFFLPVTDLVDDCTTVQETVV